MALNPLALRFAIRVAILASLLAPSQARAVAPDTSPAGAEGRPPDDIDRPGQAGSARDGGGATADGGAPSAAGNGGATNRASEAGAAAAFERPRPLSSTDVAAPADAPEIAEPVMVTVKMLVDPTGTVQTAQLQTPPHPPFDEAVLAAVRGFRFAPGRYAGAPVAVEITFTHTFLPRPAPQAPPAAAGTGPPLTSVLRGRLVELGTRSPVTGATVTALIGDRHYSADVDARGRFRLPLPAGSARVSV